VRVGHGDNCGHSFKSWFEEIPLMLNYSRWVFNSISWLRCPLSVVPPVNLFKGLFLNWVSDEHIISHSECVAPSKNIHSGFVMLVYLI
jgi:hypothetical protein